MRQAVRFLPTLVLCAACLPALAAPAPRYSITTILAGQFDYVEATGINNRGDVVGGAYVTGQEWRGYLFADGRTTQLGSLGGQYTRVQAINEARQIVGESRTPGGISHAVMFSGATVTNLTPWALRDSAASAINNAGTAVGAIPCDCLEFHAARFTRGGGVSDLGTLGGKSSNADGINNAGQIVGWAALAGPYTPRAFLYEKGKMRDLGTLGGEWSSASAINEAGHVAGSSALGGQGGDHAFLYVNGVMSDLGALSGMDSAARGMNNAGQVVGLSYQGWDINEAVLWEGGALFNLNSLIDPASGWHLTDAGAINDLGQIAASGCHQGLGVCGMLRLDPASMLRLDPASMLRLDPASMAPVPEPSTWAMLLAGLALVGMRGRRRKVRHSRAGGCLKREAFNDYHRLQHRHSRAGGNPSSLLCHGMGFPPARE
ncbi:PEPxxWA-CTERM sorting domain-containing protein [Massilia sp. CCM 8734]|uniref:PEPxxWA-CTERM sorting domain-containing protein n=1 Tax=Massilia sp. CCM 8734 TaxID=2609283 RepID=UPI0014217BDB|nr:PEPxxWA-CTERM sorting domain-containing protein [Massilia sp. CCM 8734]